MGRQHHHRQAHCAGAWPALRCLRTRQQAQRRWQQQSPHPTCRLPNALPSQGSSVPASPTIRMSSSGCGQPCLSFSCAAASRLRPPIDPCSVSRGVKRASWPQQRAGQAQSQSQGNSGRWTAHGRAHTAGGARLGSQSRLGGSQRADGRQLRHAPALSDLHALLLLVEVDQHPAQREAREAGGKEHGAWDPLKAAPGGGRRPTSLLPRLLAAQPPHEPMKS